LGVKHSLVAWFEEVIKFQLATPQPLFLALVHLNTTTKTMNLTKSVRQLVVDMNMAAPDELDVNNTVRDVVC
jgi:hypothetical protein